MTPLRIGIVGAGFSGTSLAMTLARLAQRPVEIFLFEKTGDFGPGIAYSTPFPFHLLNVPASDMSALEAVPTHFVEWMERHRERYAGVSEVADGQFVSRLLYGAYLKDQLADLRADRRVILREIAAEVRAVHATRGQYAIDAQGTSVTVDRVILSVGNALPSGSVFRVEETDRYIGNPWAPRVLDPIPADETVVLAGSGLTMIDSVLSLCRQKHRGQIVSVSRHGLMPLPHGKQMPPLQLPAVLPGQLLALSRFLRGEAAQHASKGGDWRVVITAFRERVPAVWRGLDASDKRRFLRHLHTVWNIHRHRVPREVHALLERLQDSQQLRVHAGRILAFESGHVVVRPRGREDHTLLPAGWVVNCMGPALGLRKDTLVQSLVRQGLAVFDSCGLGIEVTGEGALQDASGQSSAHLFATGSPCRGSFWECTAVPEIRKHNLRIAERILSG